MTRNIVLILTFAVAAIASAEPKPLTEQGYCGLTLRDTPIGTVVTWVFPGPLEGEGLTSPTLARPDLIIAVDGKAMTADEFKLYVERTAPGTMITIEFRRANNRGPRIPDAIYHADQIERLEVTLASREEWTGTIGRRSKRTAATSRVEMDSPLLDAFDPQNVLGSAVAQHALTDPLTRLMGVFPEWLNKHEDFHSLSLVRAGFQHPFQLAELMGRVVENTNRATVGARESVQTLLWDCLDAHVEGIVSESPHVALGASEIETHLFMALSFAAMWNDDAFGRQILDLDPATCLALLRVPRDSFYIVGPQAHDHIGVIRASMEFDPGFLLMASASIFGLVDEKFDQLPTGVVAQIPAALRGAIEGPIASASFDEILGWIVVGSTESNRYDMAKIAAVIDPGGDDEYYASDLRIGNRAIIDLTGNDLYTGTDDQGPGGALMGISLIDDRAGDDRYEGKLLSAGAAMFGASLLLDRAGNDTYIGSEWSLGAAMYGAGMIIDLGDGADTYIGEFLCQGVGGPRGFGCIIDQAGRDLYRANGPEPSAYDTPAVYQSFSQGIGFGLRHYATGGIGMINDLAGDDRYEAGEFSQGGAYYYGMGILHDAGGRDLYYGNRYSQGFGVHQAIGALIDDAGDDTYWGMTAACQGAAWDIGIGMLLDRAGNDSYQCDGLGQGGAAMQGIAMLIDLAGHDRYASTGGAAQGESGDDWYHFHDTGAHSFSLLMDLGAGDDWYSTGRANNATVSTGEPNAEAPQHATLHGLCIDR